MKELAKSKTKVRVESGASRSQSRESTSPRVHRTAVDKSKRSLRSVVAVEEGLVEVPDPEEDVEERQE